MFNDREQDDWTILSPRAENVDLVAYFGRSVRPVLVRGSNAYLRTGPNYEEVITVFDISDPAQPARIEHLLLPGELIDVDPDAHLAYTLLADGLWRVDISTPDAPTGIHIYNPPRGILMQDIQIVDDHAYVTVTQSGEYGSSAVFPYIVIDRGSDRGLHVVDVSATTFTSKPANCYRGTSGDQIASLAALKQPSPITHIDENSFTGPVYRVEDVLVSANYAYLVTRHDSKNLLVVDVTDPANPIEIGYYQVSGTITGMAKLGQRYLCITINDGDSRLEIIDLLNPAAPDRAGFYRAPDSATDVDIAGQYAYIATLDSGLRILDVSTPTVPVEISFYNPGQVERVVVVGNYAYITIDNRGESNASGMQIVDISNPSKPTMIGFYQIPGVPTELTVRGGRAYLGNRDHGRERVDIINLSDPSRPAQIASWRTSDAGVKGIEVVGDYAYIAVSCRGLRIVNISNPEVPTRIGYYNAGNISGIAVSRGYIYLADAADGLSVLRCPIADPSVKMEEGFCQNEIDLHVDKDRTERECFE